MKHETKRRIFKFIIILVLAFITRILVAFFAPIDMQKYISLIITIVAIVGFFAWDFIGEKQRNQDEGNGTEHKK